MFAHLLWPAMTSRFLGNYPRTCNLFAQIDSLITDYVVNMTGLERDAARRLQKDYYRDHGTTLNGLMVTHGIDPDHYLKTVHEIDYSPVAADPALMAAIAALPGRKHVFTNADKGHAEAVLGRLGGADLFDSVFDIRDADFQPKPFVAAYDKFLARHEIDPTQAAMFEDLEKNLAVPHARGMVTVHVIPDAGFSHDQVEHWELSRADEHPHVHHITGDLSGFLSVLNRG